MPFRGPKSLSATDPLTKDRDDDEDLDLDDHTRKDIKIIYETRTFKVRERKQRHPKTGKVVNTCSEVVMKSPSLFISLSGYGVFASSTEKLMFGRTRNVVNTHVLMLQYGAIMNQAAYFTPELKEFMEWVTEERARLELRAAEFIERGQISFDLLWALFKDADILVAKMFETQLVGLQVTARHYQAGALGGDVFVVNGQCIKATGQYFFWHHTSSTMLEWSGLRDISDLRIQPPSPATLKSLRKRGRIFNKVAVGHGYLQYNGNMIYRKQWGQQMYAADGRIMVDIRNFLRTHPDYDEYKDPSAVNLSLGDLNSQDDAARQLAQRGKMHKIPKEKLALTWPTVAGFSFACKAWGEVMVSGLSHIKFDDDAFDQLVLEESKKRLIQALVANHKTGGQGFTDIITGKGTGKIFLLHGPPGVGKTLTAEAIAEYLHQPLYSISVGELGVTVKELEAKLNEILEMAAIWNAVILIDEADIFLEQRTNADITRNAMVGIFLRLLEYHQGVLFLTTNRVRVFDRAFHSRISVALKYEALTAPARAQIWGTFLNGCGVKGVETDELAGYEMNGRQIRTAVQLAQALAVAEGAPQLNLKYIKRTLDIATQFQHSLAVEEGQELDQLGVFDNFVQ